MIFSDHALLRFVQRVIGIKDESDALVFLENNKYEVYYKFLQIMNDSELLMKNFTIDENGGGTFDYLLNGDTLIVVASGRNVVVTLYDVKVDADESINSEILAKYAKRIKRNSDEVIKIKSKKKDNDIYSRGIESTIARKEIELEELKSELGQAIEVGRFYATKGKDLRYENKALMERIMFGFKEIQPSKKVNSKG